jgi:hypothetical protein
MPFRYTIKPFDGLLVATKWPPFLRLPGASYRPGELSHPVTGGDVLSQSARSSRGAKSACLRRSRTPVLGRARRSAQS